MLERGRPGRPMLYPEGWKEHIKETKYNQNYYSTNKHIRVECPNCGKDVCKLTISSHRKTKKCMNTNLPI